jgi:WD40 repeat protein
MKICYFATVVFGAAILGAGTARCEDEEPKLRATLEGHKNTVASVAISPDGAIVASGGLDNAIKLWDPKSGDTRLP